MPRLLFIGNSYTNRNNLPDLIVELAASADPPQEVTFEKVIAGGASLRQHWNAGAALQLLEGSPWDAVILQEQSTLPLKSRLRYHENVRLFHERIAPTGAKTVLYLTWARRNAPETQPQYDEAVESIAREIEALVAPVGKAWERVRQGGTDPELFDPDGSHPSPAGSYLAACVFYATLFHRTPQGLVVPERLRLRPDEARILQDAAAEVTGVAGPA